MKKKKKSGILAFLNRTVVKLSAVIFIILGIYIFSVLQRGPLENVSEQKVISRQINIPTRQHAKSRKIRLVDTSAALTKKTDDAKLNPSTEPEIKQAVRENSVKEVAKTAQSINLAAVDDLEKKKPEQLLEKKVPAHEERDGDIETDPSEKTSDSVSPEERVQAAAPTFVPKSEPPAADQEPSTTKKELPPTAPDASPSLNEINQITKRYVNNDFIIEISTNNRLETVKYYRFTSPPRLVVDLYGEWKKPKSYKVNINQGIVKQIRLWKYPQKLRLTHDLTHEPLVKPVVKKTETGMKAIFSGTAAP